MAKATLTDLFIKKLTPPAAGQQEHWDDRVRGFGLRVSAQGAKAFVLVYRFGRVSRRVTLGRYPDLTLADARAKAQAALADVARGLDPAADRKAARQKAEPPSDLFPSVVHEFVELYARRRTKSWSQTKQILEREFVPSWSKKRLPDISKRDVLAVVEALVARSPSSGNLAFASVRKLFNWAVERDIIAVSPCTGLKMPAQHVTRDRVLSPAELGSVWHAAVAMGFPYGDLVRLLILTAQRRDEVAEMRWSELDLDRGEWNIPKERTKNGQPHVVALTPVAVLALATVPRLNADFVFPARGGSSRPISGFSKWKTEIDRLSGVADWRIHDLRRTAATRMAELGVHPHVIEAVLNHVSKGLSPIARVYNRHSYLAECRAALDSWSSVVTALTAPATLTSSRSAQKR